MSKSFLLLFLVATVHMVPTVARSQAIDSLISAFEEQYPLQKVYVHFDKNLYRAGETMWFKAYLLRGNLPETMSRNFYTELIDNNGTIVQRKVYPINAASAAGSITLPANLPGNAYRFRAYTSWMLNFDSAFLFQKNIAVVGNKNVTVRAPQTHAALLSFYPEGGDLVTGLSSVVAFKANNDVGMPVTVNGKIVTDKGEIVATFKDDHDGMGVFNLKPLAGEKYIAQWTDNSGTSYTTPLPAVKDAGIVLHISDATGKKNFAIQRSENVPESWKKLIVIASIGQQMWAKAVVPMRGLKNGSSFPLKDCPAGILQITVLTETLEPIAERITMVKSPDALSAVQLTTPIVSFEKRQKNSYELEIPDTNITNLSVSVTDGLIEKMTNEDNIVSHLLMTGEIKGYIHNPSYYFLSNADSVSRHLDLVMLTHGWRRYNWSDVVQGKKFKLLYPKDSYITLHAKVFGLSPSAPLRPDEKLFGIIVTKDSSQQWIDLRKTGRDEFTSGSLIFYDTVKMYYQFMQDKKLSERVTVRFGNGLYQGSKKINLDNFPPGIFRDSSALKRSNYIAGEVIKYGSTKAGSHELANVTVRTKVKSPLEALNEKYAKGLFSGGDAYSFDFTNDAIASNSGNVLAYLAGKVAGMQVSDAYSNNPSVSWRGGRTSLYLDEMPVEAQVLASVSANDVAYVKVFRPIFFGPSGDGSGGAVVVYTKKGNDVKPIAGKGLEMNVVTGYSSYKDFYAPNYSKRDELEDTQADYRTTLYWNPYVIMDAIKQKVKIEFYNNDVSKNFKIVVEGVNYNGQLVRIEKTIQ